MSDDEADLWPVRPAEIVEDTLSDLDVSPKLFSLVAALTVAICENSWLQGSNRVENDPDWREILIPDGHGIAEYRITGPTSSRTRAAAGDVSRGSPSGTWKHAGALLIPRPNPDRVHSMKARMPALLSATGDDDLMELRPGVTIATALLEDFARRHGIRRLSLFGSALRDDFTDRSDVDLLVEFEPDRIPGLFRLASMERELESLIGRPVDLRTYHDLSKFFRDNVAATAQLLYAASEGQVRISHMREAAARAITCSVGRSREDLDHDDMLGDDDLRSPPERYPATLRNRFLTHSAGPNARRPAPTREDTQVRRFACQDRVQRG